MMLAAISRISSSAAWREAVYGSTSEWGQQGLCQCYAAPELSCYSPLGLQSCPKSLSIGVAAALRRAKGSPTAMEGYILDMFIS